MKIVMGADTFYPHLERGGEVHAFHIARWLVKFGHEVTVLCAKTSSYSNEMDPLLRDYEEVEGIKIVRSKKTYNYGATVSSLPSLLEQYSYLKKMIRNNEVDIVNIAASYRPCLPFFMAAKGKVPCIATIHFILLSEGGVFGFNGWKNYELGKLPAIAGCLIENIMLRLPYDGLMITADCLREDLLRYYPQKSIKVIYGGVDLREIDNVVYDFKDPNQIVFLGSINKHKNILDAIEATKLARNEIKDLKLVIISTGGEYEGLVEDICKKDRFIKYYKNVSDEQKFKILKESSLLIHPSFKETFGIASVEALACGTPFIGYDVPSMREIVQRIQGGELVPYKDCKALSQKICELLGNKSKREKLARQGREAVENKFTWEKTARRAEEAFEGFLK